MTSETPAHGRRAAGLRRRLLIFSLAALSIVTVLGLSRLWEPPAGDQALFLLGASKLHTGGLLYRDFWDLKQPGIFEFYLGAGIVFGFTPLAVHVLELVFWLVLGIAQIAALGPSLRRPGTAAIAPVLTAAAFYLGASIHDFGQPESLAGAPLFFSLWLLIASLKHPRRAGQLVCAAGLLVGMALIGKLLFALIAAAAIAAIIVTDAPPPGRWIWRLAALACCALVPLGAYLTAAAVHHELAAVIYTWFVLPRSIITALPHAPPSRLFQDVKTYLTAFAIPIPLAVIATFSKLGPEARVWRNAMLAWIAAAGAVILMQRFSWWEYHFMLFVVPIGALATLGCDVLIARLAKARNPLRRFALPAVCIAVVLLAPPVSPGARRTTSFITTKGPFSGAAVERYRRAQSQEYRDAADIAASLPQRKRQPESIFVAGDPLVFTASNTVSNVSINGWGLELLLPSQWRTLQAQLAAAHPDDVFVDPGYATLIGQRSPSITAWLRRKYRLAESSRLGTWYERNL